MKIIRPEYEILTDISDNAIVELQRIEKAARVCYKSEDKITEDGVSAMNLVKSLIDRGHEAMLEHSDLSVKFIVDRGFSHEMVRHRLCSFAQESTRWCNYSGNKFDGQLTFVMPLEFNSWFMRNADLDTYSVFLNEIKDHFWRAIENHRILKDLKVPVGFLRWAYTMYTCEEQYMEMIKSGCTPQLARSVLPTSVKTELVVTANYREWRNIFKLRTANDAHPDMRMLMKDLLKDISRKIPVVFDDIANSIDWDYEYRKEEE